MGKRQNCFSASNKSSKSKKVKQDSTEVQKYLKEADKTDSPELKIKYFSKAIEINTNDTTAYWIYFVRGNCWVLANNPEKAISDYNKAIGIATKLKFGSSNFVSQLIINYYYRGTAYCILEKYQDGMNDFTKIIENGWVGDLSNQLSYINKFHDLLKERGSSPNVVA